VIFDDFGHLQEYPRLRELFWIYVNERYDNKLPTIFTANLDGWDAVTKHFGEHFCRRIQAMSNGLAILVDRPF
jgi:DNA replication protein DnaC